MPILGSSNSAPNKNMMSKIQTNGDTVICLSRKYCGEKGEIALYEQFLLFPPCFQNLLLLSQNKYLLSKVLSQWLWCWLFVWAFKVQILPCPCISGMHFFFFFFVCFFVMDFLVRKWTFMDPELCDYLIGMKNYWWLLSPFLSKHGSNAWLYITDVYIIL